MKLSGESLKGDLDFGLDSGILRIISEEIKKISHLDVQISIVTGGGNFWRGYEHEKRGMDRSTADYAGMLATIMNAISLQDALEKGRLVLFAGGTGNPFMSTDTAAALRSIEINADVLVMAKNDVDGLYDSDPNVNTNAKKIVDITHHDALNKRLEALDSTALTLCMDNSLPIIIFDLFKPDNLLNVLIGKEIGTLINTPKI